MTDFFHTYHQRVNITLKNAIYRLENTPPLLRDAMHYATSNGGKRLRPLLVYLTGECFGVALDKLDALAAAIECIHAYSLIHDDLPAMDDDNLRRGKPTCHVVFSEAIAVLAGDALQTLAFDFIAKSAYTAETRILMIHLLSQCAGAPGMIGGQALDMLSENKALTYDEIETIHHLKTGALMRASVLLGALAAHVDKTTEEKLERFARHLGLAFQLQDDLQDAIGDVKKLGKHTGQDAKHQKSTYTALLGIDATQKRIQELTTEIDNILSTLPNGTALTKLCRSLIKPV